MNDHTISFTVQGADGAQVTEQAHETAKGYFVDAEYRLTKINARPQLERLGGSVIMWEADVDAELVRGVLERRKARALDESGTRA